MQFNIGTTERAIRLIVGILLLLLPLIGSISVFWSWVSAIIGIVLIVTAALRFCPAWSILGINTRDRK